MGNLNVRPQGRVEGGARTFTKDGTVRGRAPHERSRSRRRRTKSRTLHLGHRELHARIVTIAERVVDNQPVRGALFLARSVFGHVVWIRRGGFEEASQLGKFEIVRGGSRGSGFSGPGAKLLKGEFSRFEALPAPWPLSRSCCQFWLPTFRIPRLNVVVFRQSALSRPAQPAVAAQ